MGTEFDVDRLSRGINFMGIVCPVGQKVGDRKSRGTDYAHQISKAPLRIFRPSYAPGLPCGLGLGPPVCRSEEIPPQSRMSSNSKSAGVDSFRAGWSRLSRA